MMNVRKSYQFGSRVLGSRPKRITKAARTQTQPQSMNGMLIRIRTQKTIFSDSTFLSQSLCVLR
jgi:hypothetical protein